jgi:N-acetylglucosamine kinase-like BadF-type ATPase
MGDLYLGIDGGQSSTTALLADEEGRVLGYGRGGPCNHLSGEAGRQKFFRAVGACLQKVCDAAGLSPETITFAAVCLGLSGGAEDKEVYARELIRSHRYKFTNDADIALSGATAGEPGIIIVGGTGSVAFGRNAEGRTARAGGWGYIFGDEGGGFVITRQALRAALRFEEGWGPPTSLRDRLLSASGAASANALLHQFYAALDRPYVASLAALVTEAAQSGDAVASGILSETAAELCTYVAGVYNNLFTAGVAAPVYHIGGVFRSRPLLSAFEEQVKTRLGCTVKAPRYGPAAGALLEAFRLDHRMPSLSLVPESEK